jgi:thiol-disulfide isomerase/thioredoxin
MSSKEGTMLSLHAAVLLAACSAGETVLIDFSAEWCGPCRQMEPAVDRLAAMGYPVRKVNIDHEQALAAQYRVRSIPCFVLVVDGREAERTVGATSFEQLAAMFQKHGVAAGPGKPSRGQSPETASPARAAAVAGGPNSAPPVKTTPSNDVPTNASGMAPQLLATAVRLKISDPNGHSYGSGTVVDVREGEALIVTCGHIFRDSQGQGKVVVDMFGSGAPRGVPGRVIGFDLKSDVGLVTFKPGCPVRTARLAAASYPVRRGDPVINIGCNNGAEPTVRSSRVTSLDKFLGPPNIQVAGQPVQGRSGGGLFSADGRVIGICNAADPTDDEGLYAALPSLWALLERHGWLPETGDGQPSAVAARGAPGGSVEATLPASQVPSMPQRMPATQTISTAGQLDANQQAAVAALASATPGAEVICIVRSLDDPRAKSEVIVLDKVSPQFIERLTAERYAQQQRHLTSVAQRTEATPISALSSRGNVVRNAPIVHVRGVTPAPVADWRPNWMRPR